MSYRKIAVTQAHIDAGERKSGEKFLERMERLVPWSELEEVIRPALSEGAALWWALRSSA